MQDEIGHEEFGTFTALYALGFLFIAFSDLGLNQYATKSLAEEPDRLKEAFPNLLSLKISLSALYPFFMVGVGYALGYSGQEISYLFFLCIAQAAAQMIAFFRANFQAFQKFRLDAFASILDRAMLLGIIIVLLLFRKISLESYIYAWIISLGVASIILYLAFLKIFGWIKPRFQVSRFKEMLKLSFPFAVITVLYSIHDKVDQVMLERLVGDKETGLYAGAYRWVDATTMYLWTVLPIFFARFAHFVRNKEEQKRLLDFGQPIAALPMVFVAVFAFFYGDKLMFLFKHSSPEEIAYMSQCLWILFLAAGINGIFAIYSTLLTSTNHERFVSWMIGLSIVVNIVLNFIFIPKYGAIASACTTVTSYALLSITYVMYIQRKLDFDVSFLILGKIFLNAGLLIGIMYGLTLTPLPWFLSTGIAGILYLTSAYLSGLIKFAKPNG